MKKFLLSLLLCLSLTSAAPITAEPSYSFNQNAIMRLQCGTGVGTAFHIGDGKYVTAAHVAKACTSLVSDVVLGEKNDFATFRGPSVHPKLEVSCVSYKFKEMYVGVGYAEGGLYLAREPIVAVDLQLGPFQSFMGNLFPGMSGGPIVTKEGKVIGVVSHRWPARGIVLNNTSLCKGDTK